MAFAIKTGMNNTFNFKQAMMQDDKEDFIKAMEKEIRDQTECGHWIAVPRKSVPVGVKIIKAIWSFKRKR